MKFFNTHRADNICHYADKIAGNYSIFTLYSLIFMCFFYFWHKLSGFVLIFVRIAYCINFADLSFYAL